MTETTMTDNEENATRIGAVASAINTLATDATCYHGDNTHITFAIEVLSEEARRLAEQIEKAEMAKRRDEDTPQGQGAYLHLSAEAPA